MIVDTPTGISNLRSTFALSRDWERELALTYWLDTAARISTIANPYQISLAIAAGMFCALSPNNTETNNYIDLANVLQHRDTAPVRTYKRCRHRALLILGGWHPDRILGQKTRSMWHNIVDPDDRYSDCYHVTVDGHMYGVWNGRRVTMDQAKLTLDHYEVIRAGIVKASRGSGLSPCQYQACLWMTWKRIHRVVYNPSTQICFSDVTWLSTKKYEKDY